MMRLAARGLTKSGHGNYEESRAARYILKDYVKVIKYIVLSYHIHICFSRHIIN